MKKLSILLAVFAAVVIFNSCNKEYAVPTITWEGGVSRIVDFTTDANYDVNLDITFAAEAGINEIVITKYIYSGIDDITTVTLAEPTGYSALTTFDYTFTADNSVEDFTGGVTKIVYEFEVTDAELQTKTTEYTIFVIEAYAVTFDVRDEANAVITDAVVTFNGVTNAAGDYVFDYIEEGTYAYTITKAGYDNISVTDFVMPANDTTVTVNMIQSLSAWSENVMISLLDNAWYNHIAVPAHENTTIGFKYTTNTATTAVVNTTTNCEGWVEVNNVDYTTVAQIEAAYNAGTHITEAELAFDYEAKTGFAPRYFISKVGSEYNLVKYIAGVTCPNDHTSTTGNKGNVLVFQYKN